MTGLLQMVAIALQVVSLFVFFSFGLVAAQPGPPPFGPPEAPSAPVTTQKGIISGRFTTKEGKPMEGGKVLFFNAEEGPPPTVGQYGRVPNLVKEIGTDGRFSAEVPPGKYYLNAIKRITGDSLGPPSKGDFAFRLKDEHGAPKMLIAGEGEQIDLGVMEVTPFGESQAKDASAITAIAGVLRDEHGNPVANGYVFAFPTAKVQGRPLFVSEKTGPDGKYLLRLATGGTFYLKARNVLDGGQPAIGEIMGVYGGKEPVGVTVTTGQVTGSMDIEVSRLLQRGPPPEAAAGKERSGETNSQPELRKKSPGSGFYPGRKEPPKR